MNVTLTPPIDEFVQHQVAKGYASADEVIRQAILRWMDEEHETPPRIRQKLADAADGSFRPGDRRRIEQIVESAPA